MSVQISIAIYKKVEDIDKANDFVDEVRALLQGNVTASMQSNISNHSPPEELKQEQESE